MTDDQAKKTALASIARARKRRKKEIRKNAEQTARVVLQAAATAMPALGGIFAALGQGPIHPMAYTMEALGEMLDEDERQ